MTTNTITTFRSVAARWRIETRRRQLNAEIAAIAIRAIDGNLSKEDRKLIKEKATLLAQLPLPYPDRLEPDEQSA